MSLATYEYRCPHGHITTRRQRMTDPLSAAVVCEEQIGPEHEPTGLIPCCGLQAARVWSPLAAIHYKASGFYSTDVKGRQERKRRKNPGDDLPVAHDPVAAAIARSF